MNQSIFRELRRLRDQDALTGESVPFELLERQITAFQNAFGPRVLSAVDGVALLKLLHGRLEGEARCLAYWLEFKNDEEFSCQLFGGIAGGSALKFEIYQQPRDGGWISGSPNAPIPIRQPEAIKIAQNHRIELLRGCDVLAALDMGDTSDAAYVRLQADMERAAPTLVNSGWAHKYWFLMYPESMDGYHSSRLQRFHLLKLLQMPPDHAGILGASAPRFLCGGRFVELARQLDVSSVTLHRLLNKRDSAFHRYWKVGTTEGGTGISHWATMRDGGYTAIGWGDRVPDLTDTIRLKEREAKNQVREFLYGLYPDAGTTTRKAGEILNFSQKMAEGDIVLACDGQAILGVGRVVGSYEYERGLAFPHKRSVKWLDLSTWNLPTNESPRTTFSEIGKYADNLLELETRLAGTADTRQIGRDPEVPLPVEKIPALDAFTLRMDAILRRKGQAILYGPPGTGKTYRALKAVNELAARQIFRKNFESLTVAEKNSLSDGDAAVRVCTFHPGWGYEEFMEGLRPRAVNDRLIFEAKDGIFKRICLDASNSPDRPYFLVIDEINRGDLPRIFGELITILEMDKRQKEVVLPITGQRFRIPRNVFLVGTMNTADRSVTLLDAALRRRFGFIEMMPDSGCLSQRTVGDLRLGPWLDALNFRLRKYLKREARNLQVGHAYLLPNQPIGSVSDFSRILRDDIIPLLQDYCFDDFEALREILGKDIVDDENACILEELFAVHREADLIQAVSFPEMSKFILAESADNLDMDQEADDADASENI